MFRLNELLAHENIIIQCHNFPDADTIACAFAIHKYLHEHGRSSRILYSGFSAITKPNLVMMISLLEVPIEYVKVMPDADVLVVVDCQYGENNVAACSAAAIYEIDHHKNKHNGHGGVVQSSLGSCSTLLWDLLLKEEFDFSIHTAVADALYYGLYTDTNYLEEISHPLDRDMRDTIRFNQASIDLMRFNNLTIGEMDIVSAALQARILNDEHRYAIFEAANCDANILGFIADLALQIENIDLCIVHNTLSAGHKFSVRTCTRAVMANEFAEFLAGGGGHRQKAGGFVSHDMLQGGSINDFINSRTALYFESYDVYDSANHGLDVKSMPVFVKLPIPVGYVPSCDIFPQNTPMLVRALEGDSNIIATPDTYLMIGILGEVWPIERTVFLKSYFAQNVKFDMTDLEYTPTVKNRVIGETISLKEFAKNCVPNGYVSIYASPLTKLTKVFTRWNPLGYMSGKPGDYIAARVDNPNDVYIIRGDVFARTYESRS